VRQWVHVRCDKKKRDAILLPQTVTKFVRQWVHVRCDKKKRDAILHNLLKVSVVDIRTDVQENQ
jgi:hypothetical protein